MNKILLSTDFSDIALNAIFTVIKLHQKSACNFTLLHAYEPDTRNISHHQNSARAGMIYDAMHQNALDKLEEILDVIAKISDNKQHSFSVMAKPGDLSNMVSELVPKLDLDLIVMGTKGVTGLKQIFLGSNTVRTLNKVRNCPILVIPKKFNLKSLINIVFPTEYADFFSKGQLNPLVKLAKIWSSQILIFHVAQMRELSEQQEANKKILKERLGSIKHSFFKVNINTTVAEGIIEFANEKFADMICLVHYDHSLLEKLTHEPVVKSVGVHAEVPLFILPE